VFENREQKIKFGSKKEETGDLRELHTEELHNMYSSSNIRG
jgi:hypothetical protein